MERARWVVRRVRERARPVVLFALAMTALSATVLTPLLAATLQAFLARWGRPSVGNFEIAAFLLSPLGLVALVLSGTATLGFAFLQVAGLLWILGDPPVSAVGALGRLLPAAPRLLRLALRKFLLYLLLAAPFAAAATLAVRAIWGDRDLNGLLVLRPPVFWYGVAAAAAPALAFAALWVRVFLRWLLALTILEEERGTGPAGAVARSAERSRGRLRAHARALLAWAAATLGGGAVVATLLGLGGAALLRALGPSPAVALPATAVVLGVHLVVGFLLATIGTATFAGLLLRLHREASGTPAEGAEDGPAAPLPWRRRGAVALAAALLVGTGATVLLLSRVEVRDRLEITAHRAGALHAPENTLAALRRAIEDGADWAEIDVQLSSDGALVVLHDFDLVRVGGPARAVAESTLAEIRALDVGRALGREPAGERVPTLDEALDAAADRIRLNIELKPPGPEAVAPLVDAVLERLRRTGSAGRHRVCSQSYEAVRRAKEAEPALEVGFIAGAALGDLSRLEVDFLMVNAKMATRRFVERARARGIQVHPWTVNDPSDLAGLLDAGADNVITDAPAEMRARLEEIRAMPPLQRLLLRARNAIAE